MSEQNKQQPQAPQQPREPRARGFEFVLEVTDHLNGNHRWPITARNLRGAWKIQNARHLDLDTDGQFAVMRSMPDIPGMCIYVNTERKTARIFDPLGEKENEDLANIIAKTLERAYPGNKFGPAKADDFRDLSADAIKTWLYWSRRYLDANYAVVSHGSVPDMREIMALPGKILRGDDTDTLTEAQRYRPLNKAEAQDATA